jgi:hypothetical protein
MCGEVYSEMVEFSLKAREPEVFRYLEPGEVGDRGQALLR